MFRDDRPPCELVPNSFWGVAVNRLKVKRQSNKMIKNLINLWNSRYNTKSVNNVAYESFIIKSISVNKPSAVPYSNS